MTSAITLRPAVAADAASVDALVQAAYAKWVPRIGRKPWPMTQDYAHVLATDRVTVAEADGALAGVLVLIDDEAGMLLDNIAVRPELAGRGIGRALLKHAEYEARRLKYSSIYLYTNEKMTENIALYGRVGYVEYERREEQGFKRVFMRKALPPPTLVWPAAAYLPSYIDALESGWSPNTLDPHFGQVELERIRKDSGAFLASLVDREGAGEPVKLPDGTLARRLPGYRLWVWDGAVCGSIGFRWQPGGETLPPHVLGHIGYSIVPGKRGLGYAKQALAQLLPHAKAEGLRYVELTTDPENIASQRVIEANGGVLIEQYARPDALGGHETLRYRITLSLS
jgi:predicted acetyltransferase